MEKCFIIESSAKLHKKYFDYIALRNKNNEIVKKFIYENISEKENFTYSTNRDCSFSLVLMILSISLDTIHIQNFG